MSCTFWTDLVGTRTECIDPANYATGIFSYPFNEYFLTGYPDVAYTPFSKYLEVFNDSSYTSDGYRFYDYTADPSKVSITCNGRSPYFTSLYFSLPFLGWPANRRVWHFYMDAGESSNRMVGLSIIHYYITTIGKYATALEVELYVNNEPTTLIEDEYTIHWTPIDDTLTDPYEWAIKTTGAGESTGLVNVIGDLLF